MSAPSNHSVLPKGEKKKKDKKYICGGQIPGTKAL